MSATNWDYTSLAAAYVKRADYSADAIDRMLQLTGVKNGDAVCDVGAGAAHLTLPLLRRGLRVTAVEPNDAMREQGRGRTAGMADVVWCDGTGEATGQPDDAYALVTFGSSFNVTDRPRALSEAVRILRPRGWFACLWNHRDLDDPLQARIEDAIRAVVPGYAYGTRREDQTPIIDASGLFHRVHAIEGPVVHVQAVDDCLEAWRSHATLQRQAGDRFGRVIETIAAVLRETGAAAVPVPYVTRIWVAQAKK